MIFAITIALVVLIYGIGFGALYLVFGRKQIAVDRVLAGNLGISKSELNAKEKILEELAALSLGLVSRSVIDERSAKVAELEESIRAEKGRITITEAELEAIDTRLRELEELKRELEVSNIDAVKELEMLRSQERDIAAKNATLNSQLSDSISQMDILIGMLTNNAALVDRLTLAKGELVETEKKAAFYEDQISQVIRRYIELKKAYDALDIEYAQLYEKQQSAADD